MIKLIFCQVLMIFTCFASAQTKQVYVPQQSYTQKSNYVQDTRVSKPEAGQSVSMNGVIGGRVIETNDTILIEGARLYSNEAGGPHITIKNTNKRIILNNIDATGVSINNSLIDVDSKANIIARGVRAAIGNSEIKSSSNSSSSCGAIFCIQSDRADVRDIKVDAYGDNSYGAK